MEPQGVAGLLDEIEGDRKPRRAARPGVSGLLDAIEDVPADRKGAAAKSRRPAGEDLDVGSVW